MYNNNERNFTDHVYGKRHGETYYDASMRQGHEREMQLQRQEQYDKMNAQSNSQYSTTYGNDPYPPIPVTKFGKLIGYLGMLLIITSIVLTQMSYSVSEITFFGQYGMDNVLLFIYGGVLVAIRAYPPFLAILMWSVAAFFGACALVLGEWAFLILGLIIFGFSVLLMKLIIKKH